MMTLQEFLAQTQAEVRAQLESYKTAGEAEYACVFAEVVMQHMSEVGMTFEPQTCHFSAKIDRTNVRLTGFSLAEDGEQLDLFVSLYGGVDVVTPITDKDTKVAAGQCLNFLEKCVEGRLADTIDEGSDAYELVRTIHDCYSHLDQIRIYVLTDRVAKAKNFLSREINGRAVKLEVMDIERLHRHWSEGKPRDEIVVDFERVSGGALPCVYIRGEASDYDYVLTAMPAETLRFMYERYGARLLEANVRSFLSATGKVNKGIRETLRQSPERFMAYNNGIVIVADEARLGETMDGGPGITWLKGVQIVNGGQTTASIYFTKRKDPETDLRRVRVPAKIIVLRSLENLDEEALISDISRYANSQNVVRQSDLSANRPFHIEMEKLALSTYCPDGVGRWFYERAAGSYNVMLAREGTTPARLRQIREAIPSARKFNKTDLAKFLNAWDQRPHIVSLGSQKNFESFMSGLPERNDEPGFSKPGTVFFKHVIAKAILFRSAHALIRPMFEAFQANIGVYLVSLLSNRLGGRMDLDRIWLRQELSPELKKVLVTWAAEVKSVLHETAGGRMVSEWAKKAECWESVRRAEYALPVPAIPEIR
jgi:hypothetical protein